MDQLTEIAEALPRYSFVIPIFNEEAVIPILVRRITELVERLDGKSEVLFVDDGSTDTSAVFLAGLCREEPRFQLIKLSRNFGHQVAITAGMEHAKGDATIVLDADLQDPPEVVVEMIEKWREGNEIVYARRLTRAGESVFKRFSASFFYWFMRRMTPVDIPEDVGDFRLVGRRALEAFRTMPERDRFVRGMFGWMGFKQAVVPFHREARAAGETKYPLWKMLRLAMHGIISFSEKPLRAALWLGLVISGFAFLMGVYAIFTWWTQSGVVQGWASTIVVVSFFSGVNLLMTGVVGLYIGGIYAEVKRRPLYIVDEIVVQDDHGIVDRHQAAPSTALSSKECAV